MVNGDHIHMSVVLRAFKEEGYHVTFEYNYKGAQIHSYSPYVDKHICFEPSQKVYQGDIESKLKHYFRLSKIEQECIKKGIRFINLSGSIEDAIIPHQANRAYYMPKHVRNKRYANISYQNQSIKWCGLPSKYRDRTGEVFFRRKEHERIREILRPFHEKKMYLLIWSIAGTMWQKAIYPWSKEVCDKFQQRHPETLIIVTGGPEYTKYGWEGKNVYNCMTKKHPFRQVLLMSRYVHALVTPETGIGIGAGIYGTPKCMLLTAASIQNIVEHDKNDFSLQSPAWCSPCHRAIYNTDTCQTRSVGFSDVIQNLPICVFFNKEKVLEQMEKMYALNYAPNWDAPVDERPVYM